MAIQFLNTVQVDTDVLYVDTTNNRVGIGTTSPGAKLDIQGTQGQLFSVTDNLSGEIFAVADISGVPIMTVNSSGVSYFDGNVGIGATTPLVKLHVETTDSSTARFAYNGSNYQDLNWEGSNIVGGSHVFKIGGAEKMRIDSAGNVGIGATNPLELLHLESTEPLIRLDDTNSGVHYIFGQDGDGFKFTTNNSTYGKYTFDANVGIGTTSPGAKLEISHSGSNDGLLLENTLNSSNYQIALNIRQNEGLIFQRWVAGGFNGNLMRIGYTGGIKFDAYDGTNNTGTPTYLLGTDASGNIVKTNTVPGSAAGPYLPLAGGTMTGDINFNDGIEARFGNSQDLTIQSVGDQGYIQNYTGNLNIVQNADDSDIVFKSDNGSGGTTEYFRLDGGSTMNVFSKPTWHGDGIKSFFGNSQDLQIYHDGTHSYLEDTGAGDLRIKTNGAAIALLAPSNEDMILAIPNSFVKLYFNGIERFATTAGGTINTGTIDSTGTITVTGANGNVGINTDTGKLLLGASYDLQIYHNSTDSVIENITGDLYITNKADDKDIVFRSDNGSGGFIEYFRLDGGLGYSVAEKSIRMADGQSFFVGTGLDGLISHSGTNMLISNEVGDFVIKNNSNDKDIIFQSDNGSGGVENYIQIDGSQGRTLFNKNIRLNDNVQAQFGGSADFQIYHDGTHSYIDNITNDLYIRSLSDDIVIQAADDIFIYTKGGEDAIIARGDGVVELYYDNTKKLSTGSVSVGTATTVGGTLIDGWKTTTQANAINDTTIATTAYVNNKIGLIPAGLVFQGTWNAATNTPTLTSGSGTTGNFYIVSVAGSTNLDGITDWKVGDWAVFIEQGASDQWEKIDNSSVLDGFGTGQSVTKWDGSGTSNTLTDGPITFSGNNSTFAGAISTTYVTSGGFTDGYITWNAAQLNRYGAAIELQYTPTNASTTVKIGANGSNPTTFNAYTGDATFSGNVGIGTANPLSTLHVESGSVGTNLTPVVGADELVLENSGDAGLSIFTPNSNKGSLVFGDPQDAFVGGLSYNHSNNKLTFKVNNSDEVVIDSSGNVGIGTTNPSATLHLSAASPYIYVDDTSTTGTLTRFQIINGDVGTTQSALFGFNNTSGTSTLNVLTMNEAGNVGIGTTSPGEKLDVNGNIKIKDALLSNQANTNIDTGAEVVAQVSTSLYTAAFFDFVIKKVGNIRSGTVYACHDGTNVEFTETSTQDLGDTSDVILSVDKSGTNLRLIATVTSDDWIIKTLVKAI